MSLDLTRLEKIRPKGDGFTARCPACAEAGLDRKGNHLWSRDRAGKVYGCTVNPKPGGKEHRRQIHALAGLQESGGIGVFPRSVPVQHEAPAIQRVANTELPILSVPTDADLDTLARSRNWNQNLARPALRVLADRGLLWIATHLGQRAWVVTDANRYAWRARRLDRKSWWGDKKTTTKGPSLSGWIIGAETIGSLQWIVLCEGEADLLAAAIVAHAEGCDLNAIAFVCVFGAVEILDPLALNAFAGKKVIVIQQYDKKHGKGAKTAEEWLRQLHGAGATKLSRTRFENFTLPNGEKAKDMGEYAETLTGKTPPTFLAPFLPPPRTAP